MRKLGLLLAISLILNVIFAYYLYSNTQDNHAIVSREYENFFSDVSLVCSELETFTRSSDPAAINRLRAYAHVTAIDTVIFGQTVQNQTGFDITNQLTEGFSRIANINENTDTKRLKNYLVKLETLRDILKSNYGKKPKGNALTKISDISLQLCNEEL